MSWLVKMQICDVCLEKNPQRISKTTKLPGKVIAILICCFRFYFSNCCNFEEKKPSRRFFQLHVFHFMTYYGRKPPISGFLNVFKWHFASCDEFFIESVYLDYFKAFVNACGKGSPGTSTRPLWLRFDVKYAFGKIYEIAIVWLCKI